MIPSIRQQYNLSFSAAKYEGFLADLSPSPDFKIKFRVAETPLFIPRSFKEKLIRASEEIIDFLVREDFKKLTNLAIPVQFHVPAETDHTLFLALDYAIVKDDNGEAQPQLIEMQGFPSLFGFQDYLAGKFRKHFEIPADFSNHFGLTETAYQSRLRSTLLGNCQPENVVLLEIDPLEQNTAVDFIITQQLTGIRPVHLGDIRREGRTLFYSFQGRRIPIHRIYNRVIFDELARRTDLKLQFHLTEDVDVEWAGHPNWYYRISKFTMPFIKSAFVPECRFLNELSSIPGDLENYVLKPLFSFSGSGVIFHVTQKDVDAIPASEHSNYLLQRKVQYEPVIEAPDGFVKAEIRLLFLWDDGKARPELVTNLARLSRGEMIGVKFNKDKTWVGGSVCFFEP
jgi:uncharacterized protein (UPF0248 family)